MLEDLQKEVRQFIKENDIKVYKTTEYGASNSLWFSFEFEGIANPEVLLSAKHKGRVSDFLKEKHEMRKNIQRGLARNNAI
jgi:hypothetical protein